jgi:signal-transduction protein with cAMP-binding, CBS, and nucleotidyltransferase domain
MRRDLWPITVTPDTAALVALERMQRTGSSRLLVAANERLLGLVSLKDLLRFLQLKLELADEGEDERNQEPVPAVPAPREETPAHV